MDVVRIVAVGDSLSEGIDVPAPGRGVHGVAPLLHRKTVGGT